MCTLKQSNTNLQLEKTERQHTYLIDILDCKRPICVKRQDCNLNNHQYSIFNIQFKIFPISYQNQAIKFSL